MARITSAQLRRFARLGAVARLRELRHEEAAIRKEFPELFGSRVAGPARARRAGTRRRAKGR